jgi:hypothetical protein
MVVRARIEFIEVEVEIERVWSRGINRNRREWQQ